MTTPEAPLGPYPPDLSTVMRHRSTSEQQCLRIDDPLRRRSVERVRVDERDVTRAGQAGSNSGRQACGRMVCSKDIPYLTLLQESTELFRATLFLTAT